MNALLLAQGAVKNYHQFARVQALDEWWHWLLLLIVTVAIGAYVVWMYRRDCEELPRPTSIALVLLRLAAFGGILFYYLQLERRSEREFVKPSRVMVLVDTSQSMSLRDLQPGSTGGGPSRIEAVTEELAHGSLLPKLRAKHDVVVARFDQGEQPTEVATFLRVGAERNQDGTEAGPSRAAALRESRIILLFGAALLAVSAIAGVRFLLSPVRPATAEGQSWSVLVSAVTLIAAIVLVAVANLRHLELSPLEILGLASAPTTVVEDAAEKSAKPLEPNEIPWPERLLARGGETRLGDAVRSTIDRERGGPLAAIIVLTDGGQNAGLTTDLAVNLAKEATVSIYPVGIGSDVRASNIRVVDLEAPQRVFPGDKFTLTGYVQALGLDRTNLTVELVSADEKGGAEVREDERTIDVGKGGQVTPVKFEIEPDAQGLRTYKVRVKPLEKETDKKDNEKSAKVEIIERKTKVLLLAGGPTREFIFLRNQLYRDRESSVDVYLQTGKPGISQDADEVLQEFPKTADELFEYDCMVAFDPDWDALDELQIKLLERWIADKAGGLIVVAGPVFTPQWSSRRRGDPKIDPVKSLYPVAFYSQAAAATGLGRFGSEKAWPLNFTREGSSSEFLWLDDDSVKSERAWQEFAGVYGYYAVKDPKPGARVLSRFSDPDALIDNELPIYMASQYYGSGRVFFQASGEMWRLRAVDDALFEHYYTKLIRWAAEGRLLRDSNRGVLLADKDRCFVGDEVTVRAILQDSQHRPLARDSVTGVLVAPDGKRLPITLRKEKEAAREGTFSEQFTVTSEGDWRIDLPHPTAPDQVLTREIRVRVPALETERPERNDALLREIADRTGGEYFVGLNLATGQGGERPPLAALIKPQDQVTVVPGSPDRAFQRLLAGWLMAAIVGALSMEWLIRRLSKLA